MSLITCQQPDMHCPFIFPSTHKAQMWRQGYTSGWDTCSINMGTTSEVWLPHPDTLSNWAWQPVEHGIGGRLSRKVLKTEVKFPGTAAAAAAKSLQLCATLCDPMDGSPPGSPIPEILQARTLESVAIAGVKILGYTEQDLRSAKSPQAITNEQGTSSSKQGVRDHSTRDPDPSKVNESQFYRGSLFFAAG